MIYKFLLLVLFILLHNIQCPWIMGNMINVLIFVLFPKLNVEALT